MSEQEEKGNKKEYVIIINGEQHEVKGKDITFEGVVSLAFPVPPSPETVFTVTYRGAKKPKEGSLKAGGKVEIHKQNTVFNVTSTTKS